MGNPVVLPYLRFDLPQLPTVNRSAEAGAPSSALSEERR